MYFIDCIERDKQKGYAGGFNNSHCIEATCIIGMVSIKWYVVKEQNTKWFRQFEMSESLFKKKRWCNHIGQILCCPVSLCATLLSNKCLCTSGVNGAGKTTTFRMLTGDEWISAGDAYMEGYGIRSQLSYVQSEIGYCPQHDALIHHMTGM